MNYKKVLVTGSSGFIGSHVADLLQNKGIETVLFDITPSRYKSSKQKEFIGNLLERKDVEAAISGCQAVFHFAAQADIGLSSDEPSKTIKENIIGTQNLLDASIENGINRFIFASTIYVYSELGSFYRVSKQACEKIIEEYQKEFGLNFSILRFGSLYGPRANGFNFIDKVLKQALQTKKIFRRGDGEEIREYIHVKDAAELSISALDNKYKNKHLIITGNQQIKVKDLLVMIKEILGGDVKIEFGKEEELFHYEITPYNYKPQIAQKITPAEYYDLGQGLMDQIYDLEISLKKENGSNGISLHKYKK